MADHARSIPSATEGTDATNQEEQQPQTYDDKLAADFYKDYSSQNELFKQVIIAFAMRGGQYGKEVIDAYNLLKKPLDPKKLVEDPVYKKQVERAMQLVKRHEGGRLKDEGKSKYKVEVRRTETALGQVRKIHEDQVKIRTSLSEPYAGALKITFG